MAGLDWGFGWLVTHVFELGHLARSDLAGKEIKRARVRRVRPYECRGGRRQRHESADTSEQAATESPTVTAVATLDDEDDPVAALRAALRFAPGDWFVVHSYAGYENKVKTNLETRITSLDMEDFIYQVEVPTREEVEVKNGKRQNVRTRSFRATSWSGWI